MRILIILFAVICLESTYEFVTTDPYAGYRSHTDDDILVFSYDDDRRSGIDVYEPEVGRYEQEEQSEYDRVLDHWAKFER